uniref:EF-hand domain-containing protein n=1 Tax=Nelumbo nucifera TaxID=4432 RepID=A0A822XF12_NELNU|nr:TPA_asm: hypothetical protein HUJ06_019696 [Nelumbo nucifera]
MQQIREAALAYYGGSSDEVKQMAMKFFKAMDYNGDGKVSVQEFQDFLRRSTECRSYNFKPSLFTELDEDGNGLIDFSEAIVFFYIIKWRAVFCVECGSFVEGLYFTCVECFQDRSRDTYNLCSACFRSGKRSTEHQLLVDNYAMLQILRESTSITPNGTPNRGIVQIASRALKADNQMANNGDKAQFSTAEDVEALEAIETIELVEEDAEASTEMPDRETVVPFDAEAAGDSLQMLDEDTTLSAFTEAVGALTEETAQSAIGSAVDVIIAIGAEACSIM